MTPHINKWDYWNYKIRETGTGTEYYLNTNHKAGVTPDEFTKDGTAYYETIIQAFGYGSYGIGINWTEPGDYS